jgi:hypothetical protein
MNISILAHPTPIQEEGGDHLIALGHNRGFGIVRRYREELTSEYSEKIEVIGPF